jgi:hypothetical protein
MLQSPLSFAIDLLPRRNGTRALLAGTLLLAMTIVVGGLWVNNIGDRAGSLARELQATAGAAQLTIGTADANAVAEIKVELTEAIPRAQKLQDDLWPLRAAGFLVGWYPVLGDNVTAAPDMADRLVDDMEAALEIIDAAERLLRAYEEIPRDTSSINETLASLPDEVDLIEIRNLILASDEALTRSEATAEGVKDSRLWGRLGAEARRLRGEEEDLRDLVDWAFLATDSLVALTRLADSSEDLASVLESGDASELNGETLRRMPQLAIAAGVASDAVSATVASTPDAVANSSIGSSLQDLEPVLDALYAIALSGSRVSNVVTPAFDSMEASGGGLFGRNSNLLAAIDIIGHRDGDLRYAGQLLKDAQSRLAASRAQIESASAISAADALATLSHDLELAISLLRDLPKLAPEALGAKGEKKYLVLAESADEIRASGGFVSGAWLITFDQGVMTQSTYMDIVEVDDIDNLASYPPPPELLANHMDASTWLLRDVSWEPDFPSVARSAAEILKISRGGLQVDGVIALTQWAMLDLAGALGSIDTPEGPLPANRLLSTLEAGTDEEGREFMNTLFSGLLAQLNGSAANGQMFQLTRAASKTLADNQALVHLFDDDLQEVVKRAGWDGTLHGRDHDRVAVIDSNIGWSKVDRNINRSLEYEVKLNLPSQPSTGNITIRYENTSGDGASNCTSQRMERGSSYESLKNACYWNLIRLYPADGAILLSAAPLPLPERSVYAGLGLAAVGDDTVNLGFGPAGRFVSGLMVVPPGETVETSFAFELSSTAVEWGGEVSTYTLSLSAQPGTQGRTALVHVELPPGQEYAGGTTTPSQLNGQLITFEFQLREDTELVVRMKPTQIARISAPPMIKDSAGAPVS